MDVLESIYKILGPMTLPFLAGVGLFSLPGIRGKISSIFKNKKVGEADSLAEKLLVQNESQMERFLEVYRENTAALHGALNAIRALSGEIEVVTKDSRSSRQSTEDAFSRVHQRLDIIVASNARKELKA